VHLTIAGYCDFLPQQTMHCIENEIADRLSGLPDWKRDLVIKKRSQTSTSSDQVD
jgi:hypothetical protein